MTSATPKFGTISRERILKSGKRRCSVCGKEISRDRDNDACRRCAKRFPR